jgi:hypothetical protein
MREVVRSARRANFYITENSFIDEYAREVGTTGVAVYHVLERHANCETRSTWIGTAKVARLLNLDQRTIQRTIKKLESLRLIRIVRSENMTTFFIVPVPPRAKTMSAPLFDNMSEVMPDQGDTDVASATSLPWPATVMSPDTKSTSRKATSMPQIDDIHVAPYKEEQDLPNNTQEQDFFYKTLKTDNPEIRRAAQQIIKILSLPHTSLNSVIAAVELEARETTLPIDEIKKRIWTEAMRADHRNEPRDKFLEEYQARRLAERILDRVNLPPTNNVIITVMAALKAEAKDKGLDLEETADLITMAALEDRRRGIDVHKYYFENCKWRSNVGVSKAERRKLDNLEVNARVKQRFKDRIEGA